MMPSLILVRHGTPTVDPAIPSTDWRLSSAGKEASVRLASKLEAFRPSYLLSSPERKAYETANIIGYRLGLAVGVEANLREHERTKNGFLSLEDFEAGVARLFSSPRQIVFGEESAIEVFRRVSRALLFSRKDDQTIVAVTHGTTLSIYMSQTFGVDGISFWRDLKTPMAIVISRDGWEIITPEGSQAR